MSVKRFDIADYLNVGSATAEEYVLLGKGVEKLDEEPNAQTDETTYICDKASTTDVIGYKPQFPYTSEIIVDEKAVMSLYKTGRDQETGIDAERDYVRVELFSPVESSPGTYKARKFKVTNVVDSSSGEGGEKVKVAGTLHVKGNFIDGTFNVKTKAFTATTSTSEE